MRILFLAHRLPYPPDKGDRSRGYWELRALSRRHDVDVFCFHENPADLAHAEALRAHCRSVTSEMLRPLAARFRALHALVAGEPFTLRFYRSSRMVRSVREALRKERYDAVFVFSSAMGQYAEGCGCPIITDMVDVDSQKWLDFSRHARGPKAWLWRTEATRLSRHEGHLADESAATVLATAAEAALLAASGSDPERIRVIPTAIDLSHFDPAVVPTPAPFAWPYAVLAGSMDYLPNEQAAVDFVGDVVPRVRSQVANARFVIVGRNPTARVRALASEAVIVTGTVPDVRPYVAHAAVAVAPMRISRGVPTKVLESLALGVPTCISAACVPGLAPGVVAQCVVAHTPEQMAQAVVDAMRRPNEAGVGQASSALERRAAVAAEHDPELIAQRMDAVLAEVTNGDFATSRRRRPLRT